MTAELMHLHDEAMEIAELGDTLRKTGDVVGARQRFLQAFNLAAEAASGLSNAKEFEPTRSLFYRSAAALALDAGETRECERLVCEALTGSPPLDIADELRDIWQQANFEHHLLASDLKIGEPELIISIWGGQSGSVLSPFENVIHKLDSANSLSIRTAERLAGITYRESGPPSLIRRNLPIYTTPAMSRIFAVVLRFGERNKQMSLFPDLNPLSVVEEVINCLQSAENGNLADVRLRIKDSAYFRNFLALTRTLTPHRKSDPFVGFATAASGQIKRAVLSRPLFRESKQATSFFKIRGPERPRVELSGKILGADAVPQRKRERKNTIVLVDDVLQEHQILVPRGMMKDVVRKYFDQNVVLHGHLRHGNVVLETIDPLD